MKKIKYNEVDGVVGFSQTVTTAHIKTRKRYLELGTGFRNSDGVSAFHVLVALIVVTNDFDNVKLNNESTPNSSFQIRPKIIMVDRKGNPYYKRHRNKVYLTFDSQKKMSKAKVKLKKHVQREGVKHR